MEQRCVLCNVFMSDEEITGGFVYADWEAFGRWSGEVLDEYGQLQPPEGANLRVIWDDRFGWCHMRCQLAYGSGQTPDEQSREHYEAIVRDPDIQRLWRQAQEGHGTQQNQ